MAGSWSWPKLINKIKDDIHFLQQALNALLKRDPTSISDIPTGAKRLVEISAGKWQEQEYNGTSWEPLGKLMHDVDTLDGYNAAITPQANTVAVRNKNGLLEDSITGNAASSDVADTLSQTLPVNKGGTGATTSAAARQNLGVPPTSHASSSTTYGLGSNANYGHVRGDGVTTNVVSGEVVAKDIALGGDSADPATGRGYLAKDKVPWYGGNTDAIDDFNALTLPGCYQIRFSSTTQNAPDGVIYNSSGFDDGYIEIYKIGSASTISSYARLCQRLTVFGTNGFTTARRQQPSSTGAWYSWQRLIDSTDFAKASTPGIMQPGDGLKAGSGGIVDLDDTVLRTSGNQYVSGPKINTTQIGWVIKRENAERGNSETNNTGGTFCVYDKNGKYIGALDMWIQEGETRVSLYALNGMDAEDPTRTGITIYFKKDGTKYASCPTPPSNSNTTSIATTEWVRKYTLPTSALVPSFATSMTGYLLCNGAAVSRTTYANLFSIIGTKFGAGNDSTTFNLPDFRNRVFWGANGNLMSVIEAGLPDHSHSITVLANSRDCGYADGGPRFWQGFRSGSTEVASVTNSIYGNSTTVQPPAIAVNIFIKY